MSITITNRTRAFNSPGPAAVGAVFGVVNLDGRSNLNSAATTDNDSKNQNEQKREGLLH